MSWTPLEEVVFACRAGAKLVFVCASRDVSRSRGYVQYRFGKADSRDPLEMMLPIDQPLAVNAATGESVPFAGGGSAWLRFRKAPFAYVVYSGIGKWGPIDGDEGKVESECVRDAHPTPA